MWEPQATQHSDAQPGLRTTALGEPQVSLGKPTHRAYLNLSSLPSLYRCLWTWTRWTRYNPWLAHSSPLAPGRASGSPEHCWASHGTGWCWHTSAGKWLSRSRRWWHREVLKQEEKERQHISGPWIRAQECSTFPEQANGQSCPPQGRLSWPLQKKLEKSEPCLKLPIKYIILIKPNS